MRNGLVLALVLATSAAALGWARAPAQHPLPWVRIVDVRPLNTSDAALREQITHTFAVGVAIHGYELLRYQPGVTAANNRAGAGHWRLYLDGHRQADNLGASRRSYLYLAPGDHWLAAELSNADSTSLDPPIWSEPVLLHVPRTIRCWQSGWHGTPETGTPAFTCTHREERQ